MCVGVCVSSTAHSRKKQGRMVWKSRPLGVLAVNPKGREFFVSVLIDYLFIYFPFRGDICCPVV